MSGIPTQQAPGLPPQQAQPQGVVAVAQQPGILPYGTTQQVFQSDQRALNPMNRTDVQEVVAAARQRANDHIRNTHPNDWQQHIYQPHEQIPELLILIEVLTYTMEPKKTDVLRALQDMQVAISVFVPNGVVDPQTGTDIGRGMRCQWRRMQFEFVPWEARKVPIHVAIMLLNQLKGYKHSMAAITYTDPASGRMVRRQEPLQDFERPQLGFLAFREMTDAEKNMQTDHSSRFHGTVSRVQGQQGEGNFLLNMNPENRQQQPASVAPPPPVQGQGTQMPMQPGQTPGHQPTQPGPAPVPSGQTFVNDPNAAHQQPPVQHPVPQPQQPQQMQPQYQQQALPTAPPPGPPPQTQGPMGDMKTSIPMDKPQAPTPVSEVTDATAIPQPQAPQVGVPAA